MNKYELRTEKKKNAIIQAALEIINNKGFVKASIKEIAALANVSQVSIYNYFGSKDMLAVECAKYVIQINMKKARDLLQTDMNFVEKILYVLSFCSNQINLSLTEYFSASSLSDEKLKNLLERGIKDLQREIYLEYIEAGKKEKVIDPSIPSSLILEYIDSVNTIKIESEDRNKKLEIIHHLFLYGIIGK
jgi:AcrR family transcriptional regulator